MENTTVTETKSVTLPCNGAWQPDLPQNQHNGNEAQFVAKLCRFIVRTSHIWHGELTGSVDFHGTWETFEDARRSAWTFGPAGIGRHGSYANAIEVGPYWYVETYGRAG